MDETPDGADVGVLHEAPQLLTLAFETQAAGQNFDYQVSKNPGMEKQGVRYQYQVLGSW